MGLIGKAHLDGKAVNAGDVRSDAWAGHYHGLIESTRSELVLPVPGTEGRWLLNIESAFRDAFEDDEQASVEAQLRVAGFILERMSAFELASAVLKSIADAVIQTNELGVIVDVNPAAEKLLGRKRDELVQRNLDLFVIIEGAPTEEPPRDDVDNWVTSDTGVPTDSPAAALMRVLDSPEPLPLKLKRSNDVLVPVLMSAANLNGRVGGRVYVASDLSAQKRIERMEVLNKVFRQIVSEIRVPLALADAFLEQASTESVVQAHEHAEKARRQLRKADLPLERVLWAASEDQISRPPRQVFDLRSALMELVAELPVAEAGLVQLPRHEGSSRIRAPRHELLFCIRSVVTYLLRRRAQVEALVIRWRLSSTRALISLSLVSPSGTIAPSAVEAAEVDLALSEHVLENLMDRMGGGYVADKERARYRLFLSIGKSP
jgi:PAS domain-containing protein